MARIVGGIGCSHAPSLAHSYDGGLQNDPMWAPLFQGYAPAKEWLNKLHPDLMVVVYNDHMNRFFFDAYPTFALGVSETHAQADEGWGKRDLPDLPGHAKFSWHFAQSLVEDEFDPTICQEMTVDHGILSVLPLLTDNRWPAPLVPLAANVIQHPVPTPRRFFHLGRAIRHAVESYPEDLRVLVVATGGMSHQLHGELVTDVTTDRRFAAAAYTMAELYDMQHDPKLVERMTYRSPTSGDRVGLSFIQPKTIDDLVRRREMVKTWMDATCGMFGRSPDFMNITLTGFASASDAFGQKD